MKYSELVIIIFFFTLLAKSANAQESYSDCINKLTNTTSQCRKTPPTPEPLGNDVQQIIISEFQDKQKKNLTWDDKLRADAELWAKTCPSSFDNCTSIGNHTQSISIEQQETKIPETDFLNFFQRQINSLTASKVFVKDGKNQSLYNDDNWDKIDTVGCALVIDELEKTFEYNFICNYGQNNPVVTDPTKPTTTAESTESPDPTKPTAITESTQSPDPTKPTTTTKSTESSDPTKPTTTTKSTESSDPTKPTTTTESTESPEIDDEVSWVDVYKNGFKCLSQYLRRK